MYNLYKAKKEFNYSEQYNFVHIIWRSLKEKYEMNKLNQQKLNKEYGVSFWDDGTFFLGDGTFFLGDGTFFWGWWNILKLTAVAAVHVFGNVLKATALYTLYGWIVRYVDFILVKLLKNKQTGV